MSSGSLTSIARHPRGRTRLPPSTRSTLHVACVLTSQLSCLCCLSHRTRTATLHASLVTPVLPIVRVLPGRRVPRDRFRAADRSHCPSRAPPHQRAAAARAVGSTARAAARATPCPRRTPTARCRGARRRAARGGSAPGRGVGWVVSVRPRARLMLRARWLAHPRSGRLCETHPLEGLVVLAEVATRAAPLVGRADVQRRHTGRLARRAQLLVEREVDCGERVLDLAWHDS